jgi:hypothetical protein
LGKILQKLRTWFPSLGMKGYNYNAIGEIIIKEPVLFLTT